MHSLIKKYKTTDRNNIYYQKNSKVYFERNLFISHSKLMKNSFLNECIGLYAFWVLNRHLDPQRTREECSCLQVMVKKKLQENVNQWKF